MQFYRMLLLVFVVLSGCKKNSDSAELASSPLSSRQAFKSKISTLTTAQNCKSGQCSFEMTLDPASYPQFNSRDKISAMMTDFDEAAKTISKSLQSSGFVELPGSSDLTGVKGKVALFVVYDKLRGIFQVYNGVVQDVAIDPVEHQKYASVATTVGQKKVLQVSASLILYVR